MRYETEIKDILIENAIHLIAEGGFEKATTKELTHCGGNLPDFKMNEVYIYRFFGSKENLYEAAFIRLENELVGEFKHAIERIGNFEEDKKIKLYELFTVAWKFVLHNEERCRCYIRYYYSIYFKEKSRHIHRDLFAEVINVFKPLFREEADVDSILHSVFTSLFDFAIRVYNGQLDDNDINRPHIFNVLYCMMFSYFKDTENAPFI